MRISQPRPGPLITTWLSSFAGPLALNSKAAADTVSFLPSPEHSLYVIVSLCVADVNAVISPVPDAFKHSIVPAVVLKIWELVDLLLVLPVLLAMNS